MLVSVAFHSVGQFLEREEAPTGLGPGANGSLYSYSLVQNPGVSENSKSESGPQ